MDTPSPEGILLVNKPEGITSFSLIPKLRKKFNIKKIGHAGTLDPFATGVMVFLVGKNYTRQSNTLLTQDKSYIATIHLGIETDSYDLTGEITHTSSTIPPFEKIQEALKQFQGRVQQTPPMFSAKKKDGKRLYQLAREGIVVEREKAWVEMEVLVLDYQEPYLKVQVNCSKGTYIRSIAHDLGEVLGCFGHLKTLERIRSGDYTLDQCIDAKWILDPDIDLISHLKTLS